MKQTYWSNRTSGQTGLLVKQITNFKGFDRLGGHLPPPEAAVIQTVLPGPLVKQTVLHGLLVKQNVLHGLLVKLSLHPGLLVEKTLLPGLLVKQTAFTAFPSGQTDGRHQRG